MKDTQLFESVERELNRQRNNIELIASENFVSEEVLQLAGSVLTNKYAEGYPAKRYYGGCQFVDEVEELARQRICEIYGAEHANVQPHSGAQANTAVYLALLQHGDKVLGMSLADGGHLTHGHPLNFSGINYEFYSYGVSKETETIDYEAYKKQVEEIKPKLVVAGASAYSRIIDFEFMAKVAHDNGALFMVDMAHIAGLVAAGVHPSPFPYADIVTTTTHKTLRGPRGGVIMCKKEFAADIEHNVSMKYNNQNLKTMQNKLSKMLKQWKKSLKKKGSDWLLEEQITTYYLLMLKQVVVFLVKKHNVYLMKSILQLIKMQFLLIHKNHSKLQEFVLAHQQ